MTTKISNYSNPQLNHTKNSEDKDPCDINEKMCFENVFEPNLIKKQNETFDPSFKKRVSVLDPLDFEPSDDNNFIKRKKCKVDVCDENSKNLVINKLLENLFCNLLTIESFIEHIETNNLDIEDPDLAHQFFDTLNKAPLSPDIKNAHVADFLCQLSNKTEISIPTSMCIVKALRGLNPSDILGILTKKGVKLSHYTWSESEDKHVLADFFVPLFLMTNFKNVSSLLTNELIKDRDFQLISALLHCKSYKEKALPWIETPFGLIESMPLIENILECHLDIQELKDILSINVEHFTTQSMAISNFYAYYKDFNKFKIYLESMETNPELFAYIFSVIENHFNNSRSAMPLTELGFFYLIPTLNEIINDGKHSDDIQLVMQFLLSKNKGEIEILFNPRLFKLALPLFESLIETENFDELEMLLSAKQKGGCTPLFNPEILILAAPFLFKLLNLGKFDSVQRLLSKENDHGDTPLHHNLVRACPLLVSLVDRDKVEIVTDLLTKTNFCESSPIHACNNIFQILNPLIEGLIQKGAFEDLQKIFGLKDEKGLLPLSYNHKSDMIYSQSHLSRLIALNQFELVHNFLLTQSPDASKNTILHNTEIFLNLVPLLGELIEKGQFDIVENLLSNKNIHGKTPIHFFSHIEKVQEIFYKLGEKGQNALVQRLQNILNSN